MAEIADPWILDPEGFRFRFTKTEGFWEGNSRILQLFKESISYHTHFSHFFIDFEKNVPIQNNVTLNYPDCESEN